MGRGTQPNSSRPRYGELGQARDSVGGPAARAAGVEVGELMAELVHERKRGRSRGGLVIPD